MRRIVMLILLSCVLAGCGLGGPSGAENAKEACRLQTDSSADKGSLSAAMARVDHAADVGAKAAVQDERWNALAADLSELSDGYSELKVLADKYGDNPASWLEKYPPEFATPAKDIKAAQPKVDAECRKANVA